MSHLPEKKRLQNLLTALALLALAAALVATPGEAMEGARDGLQLCGSVIVPSLFPFFVLSALVVDLGLAACLGRLLEPVMRPLFRVSGSCALAVALGFVGGYPVGAQTALQLYQRGLCSRAEAERLLAFCNNSGPAFLLGVVGAGVFGSGKVGLLLYATHIAASLLVGLLFRFHGSSEPENKHRAAPGPIETVQASAAFTGAVRKALQSTLNVCAFVVFFAVVLRLLSAWGALDSAARLLSPLGIGAEWVGRLAAGLLELSSGVASLAGTGASGVPMAAFMLGWAGLSVHCQVLSLLGGSGLSARTYLEGKLCHGLLAAALTWGAIRLFPLDAPASGWLPGQTPAIPSPDLSTARSISLAAALAAWVALALLCAALHRRRVKRI